MTGMQKIRQQDKVQNFRQPNSTTKQGIKTENNTQRQEKKCTETENKAQRKQVDRKPVNNSLIKVSTFSTEDSNTKRQKWETRIYYDKNKDDRKKKTMRTKSSILRKEKKKKKVRQYNNKQNCTGKTEYNMTDNRLTRKIVKQKMQIVSTKEVSETEHKK